MWNYEISFISRLDGTFYNNLDWLHCNNLDKKEKATTIQKIFETNSSFHVK